MTGLWQICIFLLIYILKFGHCGKKIELTCEDIKNTESWEFSSNIAKASENDYLVQLDPHRCARDNNKDGLITFESSKGYLSIGFTLYGYVMDSWELIVLAQNQEYQQELLRTNGTQIDKFGDILTLAGTKSSKWRRLVFKALHLPVYGVQDGLIPCPTKIEIILKGSAKFSEDQDPGWGIQIGKVTLEESNLPQCGVPSTPLPEVNSSIASCKPKEEFTGHCSKNRKPRMLTDNADSTDLLYTYSNLKVQTSDPDRQDTFAGDVGRFAVDGGNARLTYHAPHGIEHLNITMYTCTGTDRQWSINIKPYNDPDCEPIEGLIDYTPDNAQKLRSFTSCFKKWVLEFNISAHKELNGCPTRFVDILLKAPQGYEAQIGRVDIVARGGLSQKKKSVMPAVAEGGSGDDVEAVESTEGDGGELGALVRDEEGKKQETIVVGKGVGADGKGEGEGSGEQQENGGKDERGKLKKQTKGNGGTKVSVGVWIAIGLAGGMIVCCCVLVPRAWSWWRGSAGGEAYAGKVSTMRGLHAVQYGNRTYNDGVAGTMPLHDGDVRIVQAKSFPVGHVGLTSDDVAKMTKQGGQMLPRAKTNAAGSTETRGDSARASYGRIGSKGGSGVVSPDTPSIKASRSGGGSGRPVHRLVRDMTAAISTRAGAKKSQTYEQGHFNQAYGMEQEGQQQAGNVQPPNAESGDVAAGGQAPRGVVGQQGQSSGSGGVSDEAPTGLNHLEHKLYAIKKQMLEDRRLAHSSSAGTLKGGARLKDMVKIGQGGFGTVYRADWEGVPVAVKIMVIPASMAGEAKVERMALMESAISVSLAHPNIVQTFTCEIRPMYAQGGRESGWMELTSFKQDSAGGKLLADNSLSGDVHSWELRMIMEYCDQYSLRHNLKQQRYMDLHVPLGRSVCTVVAIALDIARGMRGIHSCNIIHGDLKPHNVLLKSCSIQQDSRGFSAKVADFGLSLYMEHKQSHVSNVNQGTEGYIAPEVLRYHHALPASDVYSYGILLWELYSSKSFYEELMKLKQSLGGMGGREWEKKREEFRPRFPRTCPSQYAHLAKRCWDRDPYKRPCFNVIVDEMQALLYALPSILEQAQQSAALPPPDHPSNGGKKAGSGLAGLQKQIDQAELVKQIVGNKLSPEMAGLVGSGGGGGQKQGERGEGGGGIAKQSVLSKQAGVDGGGRLGSGVKQSVLSKAAGGDGSGGKVRAGAKE